MKTDFPFDDDKALHSLLQAWRVDASLPPRFQDGVWRRIQDEEALPVPRADWLTTMRTWIAEALPRPALATAYVAILLALGGAFGWAHAQNEAERVGRQLSTRYMQSVDPYLAAR